MKNGKYSRFLIDLAILFLSAKTGSFMCSILEHTAINEWFVRGTGALVSVVVGLICLSSLKRKKATADENC